MTKEQYKKYQQIEEGIKPIKRFLSWTGKKYKDTSTSLYRFSLKRIGGEFSLYIHRNFCGVEDNTFELPIELQNKIIETIEMYVKEKELEMEKI